MKQTVIFFILKYISYICNMKYKNYKGQTLDFKNLTQEHLSNIYWYNTICSELGYTTLQFILDEINDRFNGELLPYRPQWEFRAEINYLEKTGKFIWNEDRTKADIFHLGQKVGYYETPEHLRDKKINEILNEEKDFIL